MYWKLALVRIQNRRFGAAMSALLIALSLIPVLVAVGLGQRPAVIASASDDTGISLQRRPEGATFRPLLRRFARAFLLACAAITFLSMWSNVRPRKHELGVLRSLGASKIFVIGLVFTEAAAISLAGALLAILISQAALSFLSDFTAAAPPYSIGFKWCLVALSTVVGAAMSGCTIPCAVSLHQDVLDMLEWDR